MEILKYPCPCCGYLTLPEEPGSYYICPVCYWEDDPVQSADINYEGGANMPSLLEARKNYVKYNACEERFISKVRKPFAEEIPYSADDKDYE